MRTLRSRVIHLAHSHPEFRGQLLPLLKEAKEHNPGDVWKTIFGGWRAMDSGGEARSFKSQEEARGFIEGEKEKEKKQKEEQRARGEQSKADQSRKSIPKLEKDIADIKKMSDKEVEDKRLKQLQSIEEYDLEMENVGRDTPLSDDEKKQAESRARKKFDKEKEGGKIRENMLKVKENALSKHKETVKSYEEGEKSKPEKKASLRSRVIHLAHQKPELRSHLLPLLKS